MTGYNFELELSWTGSIDGGPSAHDCHGKIDYELTVDDDEPNIQVVCQQVRCPVGARCPVSSQ